MNRLIDHSSRTKTKNKILAIEKRPQIANRLRSSYRVVSVSNDSTALEVLKNISPRAILISSEQNHHTGIILCRKLKENHLTKGIPLIIITPESSETLEILGLRAGADDVITPSNEMQMMAFEIPNSTFVEFQQTGHMTPLERPEGFNHAVVHWLGE